MKTLEYKKGDFSSFLDECIESIKKVKNGEINYDLGLVYLEKFILYCEFLEENNSSYHDKLCYLLMLEKVQYYKSKLEELKEKEDAFTNLDERIEKYLKEKEKKA